MSISTDNVKYTGNPNKWNVKIITLASLPVSLSLIIGAIFSIFTAHKYFNLDNSHIQSFTTVLLIFMGIFTIFIIRERRHFWSSKPGTILIATSLAAIVIFFLIAALGFILPKLGIYPILFLMSISLISAIISDYPKYFLFKKLKI